MTSEEITFRNDIGYYSFGMYYNNGATYAGMCDSSFLKIILGEKGFRKMVEQAKKQDGVVTITFQGFIEDE
jgi:hypothetical protein